jgi:hypothetical protein
MAKTLKFVHAIILFLFLFLTIKEVSSSNQFQIIPTSRKCTRRGDCPEVFIAGMYFSKCFNGYCQEVIYNR